MLHQLGGWKWMVRERGSECWFKWVHPQILLDMSSFRILWCDELLPCQLILHYGSCIMPKHLLSEPTINQMC